MSLRKVLEEQAQEGVTRLDELRLFVELLDADSKAVGIRPTDLFRQLQQDLHKRAMATIPWTGNGERLSGSDGNSGYFLIGTRREELHLDYGWIGYGAMSLGTGTEMQLMARAQKLLREGGPFGGPVPEESAPYPWFRWQQARGFLRRAGICGELILNGTTARPRSVDDHELIAAYRDGTFAVIARGNDHNLMSIGDTLAEDPRLRERFPPLTARVGELAVPWRYLDRRLFRGIIPTPSADLVLLSLPRGLYGIAYSTGSGDHMVMALRPIEVIQKFDVAPLLVELIGRPSLENWLKLAVVPPRPTPPNTRVTPPEFASASPAPTPHVPWLPEASAVGSVSAPVQRPSPSRPAPGPGPVRPLPEASHDGSVPAPVQRPTASRPASSPEPGPPPIDGDTVVLQHFKAFLAEIPAGQGGSATARAMIPGTADLFLRGSATVEGTWREIFRHYVDNSYLDDMPSDKTARATLAILKASPVFRRVDTQRWRICLDECRDPKSEVFQALLREYLERSR